MLETSSRGRGVLSVDAMRMLGVQYMSIFELVSCLVLML